MKCIILCAGYATRMYPLTVNTPKPLLEVKGRPVLDCIMDKVEKIEEVDEIFIVTNGRFYENFLKWSRSRKSSKKTKVVNDMTLTNDGRLGCVGDIKFVLDAESIDDDLLVIAGDNLFDFELKGFVDFFRNKNANVIGLYDLRDLHQAKNFGIVELSGDGKILSFEEKPENPRSTLISTAVYLYSENELEKIREYFKTGKPREGPGYLIPYFLLSQDVYGFVFGGNWYDMGSKEVYEKVNRV